jgi:hypothetical protein
MTTRRRLKKEIDYVISDLVLDCMTYTHLYNKPNDENALKIIQDTMEMRNRLRDEVNHPEQKDNAMTTKSYYNNIAKTLLAEVNNGYSQLGKLIEEGK